MAFFFFSPNHRKETLGRKLRHAYAACGPSAGLSLAPISSKAWLYQWSARYILKAGGLMHVTYGILFVVALLMWNAPDAHAVPADIPADSTTVVAKDSVQVSIFGDVRFRGTVSKNPFDARPSLPAYQYGPGGQAVESRMRVGFDFSANPSTSGRVLVGGSHEPR